METKRVNVEEKRVKSKTKVETNGVNSGGKEGQKAERKRVTGNAVVTQANSLVQAKYKLTLNEQRLLLIIVSMISPQDEAFREYEIKISDLVHLLDLRRKNIYEGTKEVLRKLLGRVLEIPKSGGYLMTAWLSSADYESGTIKICFDPKLKPYLLKLKEQFTTYRLHSVLSMRSQHSIRMYQIAKQYENMRGGIGKVKVNELRSMLQVEDGYPKFADFRRYVLQPAANEINAKSDISVKFENIREGREIKVIRIIVKKQEPKEPAKEEKTKDMAKAKEGIEKMREVLRRKA